MTMDERSLRKIKEAEGKQPPLFLPLTKGEMSRSDRRGEIGFTNFYG